MRDSNLWCDERAVEGLPVRLVIAVAVGVAAMTIMLGLLDGVDEFDEREVTVQLDEELLTPDEFGEYEPVRIAVVTEDGEPITDAVVIVSGGSLPLENGPLVRQTGSDSNEVTVSVATGGGADATVAFRTGQNRGTLHIDVRPPPGTDLVDDRNNPHLTVVDG
ncbi:Ig domain-containing protein group 1 domain-containing protein [Halobacteriales archaeon QH_2_65_14]|nr:MAG: Ig domain-containing protein group 1 domain-containing protein [Halobacteriales archaeon QH_2_65_14]